MSTDDLWPSFEDIPKVTSPRTILAQQAEFLAQKTKNLLTGSISQGSTNNGKIFIAFFIVAPLIKNYSYRLLTIYHDVFYYPSELKFNDGMRSISNEEDLRETLKEIFNQESTKRIITSLLGQSKELDKS